MSSWIKRVIKSDEYEGIKVACQITSIIALIWAVMSVIGLIVLLLIHVLSSGQGSNLQDLMFIGTTIVYVVVNGAICIWIYAAGQVFMAIREVALNTRNLKKLSRGNRTPPVPGPRGAPQKLATQVDQD